MSTFILRKGNTDLARHGIFTWTIPALATRIESGGMVKTCPSAGACAALCYARTGTYRFSNVQAAHRRNLEAYLADREGWFAAMRQELQHRRYRPSGRPYTFLWPTREEFDWWVDSGGRAVRIHDAGDFFDRPYFQHWLALAAATPDVLFYAYTKEVALAKQLQAEGLIPPNFALCFSLGGRQDHLIDLAADRHDDVFPTGEALEAAGYVNQGECDLIAVLHPCHRIGIVSNNIRHLRKRQGLASFAELQERLAA